MKKGFTLVEMITVISLLAIIGLISIPVVEGIIKRSKDKIYLAQEEEIIGAAKKYATEYIEKISSVDGVKTVVCLETLKELGYLENTSIKDPRTDEYMDGGVGIVYDSNTKSYNYTYNEDEVTCD